MNKYIATQLAHVDGFIIY